MILTCPECHSQYNLAPGALGAEGRMVRCVNCKHMWFQATETKPPAAPADDAIAFETVLAETTKNLPPPEKPKPRPEATLPVLTHNPLGVSANVFGGLTFFLCCFATLTVLFLAQKPIVHHWPQTVSFYKAIGFHLKAPGEGLRLSEMTAAQQLDQSLLVEGKITNMSEHGIHYPALHLLVKNSENKAVKELDIKSDASEIASGEAAPVKIQIAKTPDGAAAVELRVKDE